MMGPKKVAIQKKDNRQYGKRNCLFYHKRVCICLMGTLNRLLKLCQSCKQNLLYFQPTHHKDYAVRLICSPEPVEDEASEDDEEPKQDKKSQKPVSMVDCDERWIATHARQVSSLIQLTDDIIFVVA